MLEVKLVEQHAEAAIAITGAIVGKHTAAAEAEAAEIGAAHVEEELRGSAGLVGQDGGEADAAVVPSATLRAG